MDYSSAWSSGRAEIRRNSDSGNDAPRYCFTLWWHPRRCPSLPSRFNRQVSHCHGQPIRRPGRVAGSPDLKLTFLLPIAVDQPPWRSQSTVPISSSGSQMGNYQVRSNASPHSSPKVRYTIALNPDACPTSTQAKLTVAVSGH